MARTNQGGSVLGFVVVAVIMAGLLIGGVYAMRQLTAAPEQGLEPSKTTEEKPTPENENKKPETKQPDKKTDESKSESQPPADSSEPASELPQTGPGESLIGAALMLAVLGGVAVSYVRSRRLELPL